MWESRWLLIYPCCFAPLELQCDRRVDIAGGDEQDKADDGGRTARPAQLMGQLAPGDAYRGMNQM